MAKLYIIHFIKFNLSSIDGANYLLERLYKDNNTIKIKSAQPYTTFLTEIVRKINK